MGEIENKLIQKSIESFILGIEVYNKPTINYRVEGFSFFICNAWELLLKSYIVKTKGKDAIYYKDKPERTISLEFAVKEVFTNEKDPLRLNLEKIIELRNTATHYIIEEYEMLYAPLFQACVNNYSDKLESLFDISINNYIKTPFLTLVTYKNQLSDMDILGNYGKEIFEKYNSLKTGILQILDNANNDKFAIGIQLDMRLVKKGEADLTVKIDSSSSVPAHIIKDIKDVNTYYPYNQKRAIEKINSLLSTARIDLILNQFSFRLIRDYFNLESDEKYCYHLILDSNPRKLYSQSLIDFFVNEIKKDHNIVKNIKDKIKESTPGAKEF